MAPRAGIDPHLWIIVTEPDQSGAVVIVNVTTLRKNVDQTVILRKRDHPFIQHDSAVHFADARMVELRSIEAQVTARVTEVHQPCPPKLLEEIKQGVLASELTPNKVVLFCKRAWGKKS